VIIAALTPHSYTEHIMYHQDMAAYHRSQRHDFWQGGLGPNTGWYPKQHWKEHQSSHPMGWHVSMRLCSLQQITKHISWHHVTAHACTTEGKWKSKEQQSDKQLRRCRTLSGTSHSLTAGPAIGQNLAMYSIFLPWKRFWRTKQISLHTMMQRLALKHGRCRLEQKLKSHRHWSELNAAHQPWAACIWQSCTHHASWSREAHPPAPHWQLSDDWSLCCRLDIAPCLPATSINGLSLRSDSAYKMVEGWCSKLSCKLAGHCFAHISINSVIAVAQTISVL